MNAIDGRAVLYIHICEVCGKQEVLTSEDSYKQGWDYPPKMVAFGVVSPRTCGDCPINQTLWWRMVIDKLDVTALTEADQALIARIQGEPGSITPKEEK